MTNTRKKTGYRILSLLLAALLTAGMLFSCGAKSGTDVMTETKTGKNLAISSNIYNYYLSYVKTNILYSAQMNGSQIEDSPEFWNQAYTIEGEPTVQTVGDFIRLQSVNTVKQMLAVRAFCEENKLALSAEDEKAVDDSMSALLEKYNKSKLQLNSALSKFSINDTILREIRKNEKYYNKMIDYLFAEGTGKSPVSDEKVLEYYKANYIQIHHILIRNSTDEVDANGAAVTLTAEQLAEREARANEITEALNGGANFADFLTESEDTGKEAYPDGYFITKETSFVPEFLDAAFEMKDNEVRNVKSSYGWHVMKRFPLSDTGLESISMDDTTGTTTIRILIKNDLQYDVMTGELNPYLDAITVDTEEINSYDVSAAANMLNDLNILQ